MTPRTTKETEVDWFVRYKVGGNELLAGPYTAWEVIDELQDIRTYAGVTDCCIVPRTECVNS